MSHLSLTEGVGRNFGILDHATPGPPPALVVCKCSSMTEHDVRVIGARGHAGEGGYRTEPQMRMGRAVLAAALVGGVVTLAFHLRLFTGWPGVAIGIGLALAIPTARGMSRRILYVGLLAFGWIPLLYWFPLPTGGLGRAGICTAALAASLAGWVFASSQPGERARRLIPEVRLVDLLPLGVAVAGWLIYLPLFGSFTSDQAVAYGLDAWDNSSHFDMTEMIRVHGATVDALAPPGDGSAWYFSNYPEAFHSFMAWVMEFLVSPTPGNTQNELSGYFNATALVVVASAVMVCAGLCALRELRGRPLIALPVVAGIGAGMLLDPGALLVRAGFTNLFLSLALIGGVVLITLSARMIFVPLTVGAACGGVSGVANNWILVTILVGSAALVVLVPFRRIRWSGLLRRKVVCSVLVAAAAIECLKAYLTISEIDASHQLAQHGDFHVAVMPAAVSAFAAAAACACVLIDSLVRRRRRQTVGGIQWRMGAMLLVVLMGLSVGAAFVYIQIHQVGKVTYYSYKYAISVEIVSLIIFLTVLGLVAARARATFTSRCGLWALHGSIGLACLTLLTIVLAIPTLTREGSSDLAVRIRAQSARVSASAVAQDVVAAAAIQKAYPANQHVVLVVDQSDSGAYKPTLLNYWVMAIASDWTYGGADLAREADTQRHGGSVESTVRAILEKHGDVMVVLPERLVAQAREAIRNGALAARIVVISSSGSAV